MRMKLFSSVATVLTVALVVPGFLIRADACVIDLATIHVTQSFRVAVMNGQLPVQGIKVALYKQVNGSSETKPSLTGFTDQTGAIAVTNLDAGTYLVATEGPGQGSASYVVVGSGAKGKPQSKVTLGWPAKEIIKTKRLAGKLLNSNLWVPFEKTVGNVQVELWTAGAQVPVAVETTTPDGQFQFKENLPGIYILHVRTKGELDGEIALDLLPAHSEAPEFLTLHLLETSCGLTYRQCPSTPSIDLAFRNIGFVGPKGVPIITARYQIEDLQGQVLAKGETDSEGNISLSDDLKGDVKLKLVKPANSVDQPIRLIPTATNSHSRIIFAVQFDGVCSSLSPEKHATPQ